MSELMHKRKAVRARKPNDVKKRYHYAGHQLGAGVNKGVVRYYLGEISSKSENKGGIMWRRALSPDRLVEVIRAGLPYTELNDLRAGLNLSNERLAPMLGISKATLHRHSSTSKRFDLAVSDRIVRFARLFGKAIEVFGGQEDARRWMMFPQHGLGGSIPLDYATTEIGAREVENLLGRIEYGVYS